MEADCIAFSLKLRAPTDSPRPSHTITPNQQPQLLRSLEEGVEPTSLSRFIHTYQTT